MITGGIIVLVSIFVWVYHVLGNLFLIGAALFIFSLVSFLVNRDNRLKLIRRNKARVAKIRKEYFDTTP